MKKLMGILTGLALLSTPAMADEKQQQQQQQAGTGGAGMQPGQRAGQQEKQMSGRVVAKEQQNLYVMSEAGAVIPLNVQQQTRFEGEKQGRKISSLEDLSLGDEVQASFVAQQNQNVARNVELKEAAVQELTGRVARTEPNQVWIEHEGALVPLRVEEGTRFEGELSEGQRFSRLEQLSAGDEVRASFEIRDQKNNVAQTVELQQQQQQQQPQQPQQPQQ